MDGFLHSGLSTVVVKLLAANLQDVRLQ